MNLQFQFTAEGAWQAMLADCERARMSIDLENYIFADYGIGREFLDTLQAKAKSGVRVRLLLDMYGSSPLYRDTARLSELRQSGIEIAFFNPIAFWRLDNFLKWFSRRDHRKLLVVDGHVAHIGSVCIDERMRDWREASVRFDLSTEPKGVAAIANSFKTLWYAAKLGKLSRKAVQVTLANMFDGKLEYITSTPHIGKRKIHRVLKCAFKNAKRSISLVTPYFVPTERLQRALFRALKRGVKVKLIVPLVSDPHFADLATHEYARSLVHRGATVLAYPTMLHAKYVLIDEEHDLSWAMMGSANLDNLSMLSNYEHVLAGSDHAFVNPIKDNFQELEKASAVFSKELMHPGLKDRLLGLLTRPIHRFL